MSFVKFRRARICALGLAANLAAGLGPTPSLAATAAPTPTAGQCNQRTASGLGYTVIRAGTGARPVASDKVSIKYSGMLASDGTVFDRSNRAEFGVGDVIPGFSEGLQLVTVGGQIRLCIPAGLGYSAAGAGPIPANADLVFEVELLGIRLAPGPLPVADRQCTTRSATGLGYTVIKAGAGEMPGGGDVVLVNYKGYLAETGALFDDAGPVPVPVGQVVPGFSEGLKLMQRGGSYRLCIPPALGYGARAIGPIPANASLIFLIDLLDFKTMAEIQAAMAREKPQ